MQRLVPGQALWRVGGRSTVVEHIVTDTEWPLIDTNAAMGGLDARRQSVGRLARSPVEIVASPLVIGEVGGVGLLWGTGVVIGSILGSVYPERQGRA